MAMQIGVLGSGQLGMLTAEVALNRGHSVTVWTIGEQPSRRHSLLKYIQASGFNDNITLEQMFKFCDVIVFENEFVPLKSIKEFQTKYSRKLVPSLPAYKIFRNKIAEKNFAQEVGVKTANYQQVQFFDDVKAFIGSYRVGFLKTVEGGYDGYGVKKLQKEKLDHDRSEIEKFLSRGSCLIEEGLNFDSEVAILAAKDEYGNLCLFPTTRTIQENGICHAVMAPANFEFAVDFKIQSATRAILEKLEGPVFVGLEFFVIGDEVIFNEGAPRAHNSGHYSLTACERSQFEVLIDIAEGKPLPNRIQLKRNFVGMLNLLGTQNGPAQFKQSDLMLNALAHQNAQLFLYDKSQSRIGRKMGHLNLPGDNYEETLQRLLNLRKEYQL